MADVFISYPRKDIAFAHILYGMLQAKGMESWIDWRDIPSTVDWWAEICEAIETADAFAFIVSRTSIKSEYCKKEIDCAIQNHKRLIPIVVHDIDPKKIPTGVSNVQWMLILQGMDNYQKSFHVLVKAVETDMEWVKAHTRLQVKALEWKKGKNSSRLLRGKELRQAEEKFANAGSQKDPQPTNIQRLLILNSRKNEERQRRQIIIGLSLSLIIMAILAIFAWSQRNVAITNSKISRIGQLIAIAKSVYSSYPQRSLLFTIEATNLSAGLSDANARGVDDTMRRLLVNIGGVRLLNCPGPFTKTAASLDHRWWLDQIATHIGINPEMTPNDFSRGAFFRRGGQVAALQAFGGQLMLVVHELNNTLKG